MLFPTAGPESRSSFLSAYLHPLFSVFIITDDRSLPFFYLITFYLVLLGYAGTIMMISLLEYLKTVFDKNAALVLPDKTPEDHLSILSCGSVPREDVSGVIIKKSKRFNFYFLVVTLNDDDKYVKNKNPVLRYFLKSYIRIFGGIMVIEDILLNTQLTIR